jgi:hypothetical protein
MTLPLLLIGLWVNPASSADQPTDTVEQPFFSIYDIQYTTDPGGDGT